MSKERKIGVIRSWNEPRGFGIIRVGPPTSLEKYFLHVSSIKSGTAIPPIGSIVHFDVSPKSCSEGSLPQAINADIILDSVEAK